MTINTLLQVEPTFHERTPIDSIELQDVVFLSCIQGRDIYTHGSAKLILEHAVGVCLEPFDYVHLRIERSDKMYDIEFNHLPQGDSKFSDVEGVRPLFNKCIAELSSHRAYLRHPTSDCVYVDFTPRDTK